MSTLENCMQYILLRVTSWRTPSASTKMRRLIHSCSMLNNGLNGVKMATNHRFLDGLGVFDHHRGTDLVASISNNSAVQRNVGVLLFQTFFTCICARNSAVAAALVVK